MLNVEFTSIVTNLFGNTILILNTTEVDPENNKGDRMLLYKLGGHDVHAIAPSATNVILICTQLCMSGLM